MDDTGASLKAAESAAATRKRRSSILKSQRPPRTPFSELEFNVATPTETAKSRRVSFSRRTGVAEFITNEATTTWKNFYEEHNKSLESSGNESAANAGRQVIGHIGKRIFDQQFEEVEVVDIGGTLQTNTAHQEFQTSFNNVNVSQQLEYRDDDMKLADPVRNFDLSSLTDHHSKIFGNDITIPVMNEMSNQMDINFSNLQSMGNSKCDDLEEIRRDLERSYPSNVVCQGPFSGRRDMSEYIEIDLNTTNVGVRSDDCDMSITDTIQSPKVQEVIKTNTPTHRDVDDWVVDKENIVVNPYTTPKETLNFAINEVSDEVLVFDGKKLTVQSEKKPFLDTDDQNIQNNIQIPKDVTPKRKTIVLNMNDDLPNFIQDSSSLMSGQSYNAPKDIGQEKKSVIYNDFDLSITQSVDNKIDVPKRKTIVFEDDMGNISITQAVPAKVIIHKEEKRKTILYENDLTNLSITQAVPTNIISGSKSTEEDRTSDGDISFTRALPSNLILNGNTKQSQNKTVYFNNDFDMSVTQAIPQNIISSKLENTENTNNSNIKNDLTNLSITQAVPCNIIINEIKKSEVGKTIIYDNNQDADVETAQVVSDDLLFEKNNADKRRTIVYDHDAGNISITQAIPSNIIFSNKNNDPDTNTSQIDNKTNENHKNVSFINTDTVSEAPKEVNNKRKSLKSNVTVYGDQAEVSFTSVMPTNILQSNVHEQYDMETSCDNDISITRALPSNILLPAEDQIKTKLETINKEANVTIPNKDLNKTESKDISMNLIGNISRVLQETKFHSNDISNLSLTKPIPTEILNIQNDFPRKCEIDAEKSIFKDNNASVNQDILIYQNAEQVATVINEINQNNFKVDDIKEISNNSFNKSNDSIRRNLTLNQSTNENRSSDKSDNSSSGNDLSHEEELIERESLKEIEILPICQHESEVIRIEENSNKAKMSILSELLDMSCSSLNDVNKSVIKVLPNNAQVTIEKGSNDSLFFITRDSENDMNLEKIEDNINSKKDNGLSSGLPKIPLQQEALETEDTEQDSYLKQKVDELKIMNEVNKKSLNRHYENVVSSDLRKSIENLDNSKVSRGKKTIKNADDTAELLEMLSDFTDGQSDDHAKNKTLGIIETKGSDNLANKSKLARLSVPKRQSIAFSREDLLNNISMAQAALQQSRFEMDESGSIEDTNDSPEEDDLQTKKSPKRSVRMSTEVVKTLQFEEDSINDDSANADMDVSPLKKTAFGETEYMKEDKARVIPSYLKDVSDGIKALMHDLVKPMADVLPHETAELHQTKKTPSTCSTQIQASLVTSSQIDIDVELKSTAESFDKIKSNQSIVTEIAAGNVSHTLKQIFNPEPINIPLEIERAPKIETKMNTLITHHTKPGPVILFDHHNPLNNILLNQIECTKVHKYNPLSDMSIEDDVDEINKHKKSEVASVSMHYNVERLNRNQFLPSGDACDEKTSESISMGSNVSKPMSVNRSTEGLGLDLKHTEVNTVIAMKANQELLESNSSLTLVDDALARSAFDLKVDLASSDDDRKSNLKVIYNMDTDEDQLRNIELDCDDEKDDVNDNCTTRKRSYSPTKQDKHRPSRPNVETTPKPLSKMQKISNSPQLKNKEREQYIEKSPDKKSPKKRNSSKPEEVITVQQLISECYRITEMDQRQELIESPSVTLDTETISATATSVTSTNTVNVSVKERQDTISVDSEAVTALGSEVSRVNWHPDVVDELSSKNLLVECSSSFNVVAKINTLPFMGSRECEWESSGGDVWMFRLLRSRIRLTVRLAHSHQNASRSRVRADTQLVSLIVDPVQEESDPLAALCVRLAAEAMRYECSRAESAGDVPALLRRCAALARVALRWARHMRDARMRLAYSVTPEGELTLKVANVPLRAVWEVRLAVELVADERGVAWPRAGHVRAASVLAGARPPSPPRLARLLDKLPRDWGHAPAVLWKVFRYLKNKTREDDLLAL